MDREGTIPSSDSFLLHSDHGQSFRLDPSAFLIRLHLILYAHYLLYKNFGHRKEIQLIPVQREFPHAGYRGNSGSLRRLVIHPDPGNAYTG